VGFILAVVIALEVGDISRFPRAEQFAAHAGPPRVHASGTRSATAGSAPTSTATPAGVRRGGQCHQSPSGPLAPAPRQPPYACSRRAAATLRRSARWPGIWRATYRC
jgi:hypothetical protein